MAHPAESVVSGVTNPTRIWFHGDPQAAPQYMAGAYAKMLADVPDALAVVCCGDFTMNGAAAEYTTALGALDPYFDRTWSAGPIAICTLGNHDIIDGSGLANFRANFSGQHTAPPKPHLDVEYGVAQIGMVRLIYVDTTSAYTAAQRAFVKSEILMAHHYGFWPVMIGHHEPYSCCDVDSDVYAPLTLPLIQEAEDQACPLCLWGHTHRYERKRPMKLGVPAAGGPIHVNLGRGTIETATTARPTKIDTLHGAPNIARDDIYSAADILVVQQPDDVSKPRPMSLLTVTRSTLLWQTWTTLVSPVAFTPLDSFSLSK